MYLTQVKIPFPDSIKLKNMNVTHKFVESFFHYHNGETNPKIYDISYSKTGTVTILIQSIDKPDVSIQQNRPIKFNSFLTKPYQDIFDTLIQDSKVLEFELVANPIISKGKVKQKITKQKELQDWLSKQFSNNGLELLIVSSEILEPYDIKKSGMTAAIKLHAVQFKGILRIKSSKLAKEKIIKGLSRSKAYGFGLLKIKKDVKI